MQNSFDTYKQFDASAFALDEDFIAWVINPNTESDTFWKGFLLENPGQVENVDHAKKLICSFQQLGEKAPAEIKERIWQSVLAGKAQPKIISMKNRRTWMAAASIIVLLIAGYMWFYFENTSKINKPVLATKEIKNDIPPGGNRATLTLANGSTIILDSAQNGSLAIQGNSQVVKLTDGKLAYQKENNTPALIQYNTISTPRGGQYQVALSDGSQVWLNAASSITFPTSFVGNRREVKITGEAYFEVAHNASMPFLVSVNGLEVQVLGTHFNINAYEDERIIKTTLLQGSVKVSKGNESVLIKPGEQAAVVDIPNANSQKIKVQNVDVDDVVAWKNGFFSFKHSGLVEITMQLSRWYDIDVAYKGNIEEQEFTGKIDRSLNLGQVLKILERTGVHFKIDEGRKLTILP